MRGNGCQVTTLSGANRDQLASYLAGFRLGFLIKSIKFKKRVCPPCPVEPDGRKEAADALMGCRPSNSDIDYELLKNE
jgi:hypothetical protein